MTEWQPLKSAPRDTTDILLRRVKPLPPIVAAWRKDGWYTYDDVEILARDITGWALLPGEQLALGRRGRPVTRYRVLEAITDLWSDRGRAPERKEIEYTCGLSHAVVSRAIAQLVEEGKLNTWLIPAGHRAVLVPLTDTPPNV